MLFVKRLLALGLVIGAPTLVLAGGESDGEGGSAAGAMTAASE